jgi:hypothetical protein
MEGGNCPRQSHHGRDASEENRHKRLERLLKALRLASDEGKLLIAMVVDQKISE